MKILKFIINNLVLSIIFVMFEISSIVVLQDWNAILPFIERNYVYHILVIPVIIIFSLLFMRFDAFSVTFYSNGVKDRQSGIISCFFLVNYQKLINLNAIAALYPFSPFSILFDPFESQLIFSLYGKDISQLSQRKHDFVRYLGMSFSEVLELKKSDIKAFFKRRTRNVHKKICYSFYVEEETKWNHVYEVLKSLHDSNKVMYDFTVSFVPVLNVNDSQHGFHGIKVQIYSSKALSPDLLPKECAIKYKKRNNPNFNYYGLILDATAPNLSAFAGLRVVLNLIRALRSKENSPSSENLPPKNDSKSNVTILSTVSDDTSVDKSNITQSNEIAIFDKAKKEVEDLCMSFKVEPIQKEVISPQVESFSSDLLQSKPVKGIPSYQSSVSFWKNNKIGCNEQCDNYDAGLNIPHDTMKCGKLLIRAYRIFRDPTKMALLKQAKVESLSSFKRQLLSYFKDDKCESAICFLLFLKSHADNLFFAESEFNELLSLLKKEYHYKTDDENLEIAVTI